MERIEQNSDRKFSSEIEAISEKLYRMNSMRKMNKDLETLAKENILKSDILKKLTMKEKWLADNNVGLNLLGPKSRFDEKPQIVLDKDGNESKVNNANDDLKGRNVDPLVPTSRFNNNLKKVLDKDGNAMEVNDDSKIQNVDPLAVKSRFNDTLKKPSDKDGNNIKVNDDSKSQNVDPLAPKSKFNDNLNKASRKDNSETKLIDANKNALRKHSSNLITADLIPKSAAVVLSSKENINSNIGQKSTNKLSPNNNTNNNSSGSSIVNRSDSFKINNPSSSPKAVPKSNNVSRSNSLKKSDNTATQAIPASNSKMQIENILGIVKKMDISNKEESSDSGSPKMQWNEAEDAYKCEKLTNKLKQIEAKSFAGTMDTIKSHMVVPTVSSQGASSVDLSKYFPNQKKEKTTSTAINQNQKTLKDIDLSKYFPTSPIPQKRSTVVTVADKLKKSQSEKSQVKAAVVPQTKPQQQQQVATTKMPFSLNEHQLDGAVDIVNKETKINVKTTTTIATTTKKGHIKIIKKVVRKGAGTKTKIKKTNSEAAIKGSKTPSIIPRDEESDRVLEEILGADDKDIRSPSLEYQSLFKEEKSPSDDLSDKIESIYQETGINLGIPNKKLLKTKSLGEGDFDIKSNKSPADMELMKTKEDGDRPTGVQSMLKRFESMNAIKPEEQAAAFKLRRMDSTTSNLNKSKESIVSHESETLSDLEKTMEYLKTEWRNEATNFLQRKRESFYGQKRLTDEQEEHVVKKEEATTKKSRLEELPVQYRDDKLAKFAEIIINH